MLIKNNTGRNICLFVERPQVCIACHCQLTHHNGIGLMQLPQDSEIMLILVMSQVSTDVHSA